MSGQVQAGGKGAVSIVSLLQTAGNSGDQTRQGSVGAAERGESSHSGVFFSHLHPKLYLTSAKLNLQWTSVIRLFVSDRKSTQMTRGRRCNRLCSLSSPRPQRRSLFERWQRCWARYDSALSCSSPSHSGWTSLFMLVYKCVNIEADLCSHRCERKSWREHSISGFLLFFSAV